MSVMASRPPTMPDGAGGAAPKRPRLSLQTKTFTKTPSQLGSRARGPNPSNPTAFNTLSNAYITSIERNSTSIESQMSDEPLTAIDAMQSVTLSSPVQLPKPAVNSSHADSDSRYLETPVSAQLSSSPRTLPPVTTAMSATPPMSAPAMENGSRRVFDFSPHDAAVGKQSLQQVLHAAASMPSSPAMTPPEEKSFPSSPPSFRAGSSSSPPPPYKQPNSLHSILRNSPLPPRAVSLSPPRLRIMTPTVRIQERAAKRVCYHSPIEQEITNNKYTKSHSDLLVEEASPCSPNRPLDTPHAFAADETDGGDRQISGPSQDMSQRQMEAAAVVCGEANSRETRRLRGSRGEKKRRWVWTIGHEDEDDEDEEELGGAVLAAARAAAAAAAAANENSESTSRLVPPQTASRDVTLGFECDD